MLESEKTGETTWHTNGCVFRSSELRKMERGNFCDEKIYRGKVMSVILRIKEKHGRVLGEAERAPVFDGRLQRKD